MGEEDGQIRLGGTPGTSRLHCRLGLQQWRATSVPLGGGCITAVAVYEKDIAAAHKQGAAVLHVPVITPLWS